MKKDISFPPVKGVSIAVTRTEEVNETTWSVYLLNQNDFALSNVFIRTTGYGFDENGEKIQTSTLRYHFTEIPSGQHVFIELLDPKVFVLNNEFWVSYFVNNQIFDKKFIFVPDSIHESNFTTIPQLKTFGVLHN
ncbi:MAG: hypothetical protein MUF42_00670 [Cytophagaceae bacterium]|jgi:hypothetical protein|nr:hypothetical protein [Cytophagaceae bacterium]